MSNPHGRPSKYNPEYAQQLLEALQGGMSKMEAAAELQISRDTMYRWAKEHEEFNEALNMGTEWSEAQNAKIIKAIALGQVKGANVAAYQMYMRNTANWDKNLPENGNFNQTIHIGQMNNLNVLEDKSTQELIEYCKDIIDEDLKGVIDADYEKLGIINNDEDDS